MAGLGEFGGGLLTALGLLNPLGPILVLSAMAMAAVKGHWGKPIWVTSGGAELPVVNMAVAGALALTGPGACSLDRLFGLRVPRWMTALFTLGALGTLLYGTMMSPGKQEETATPEDDRAAA
jgi:putative oxidoreductase